MMPRARRGQSVFRKTGSANKLTSMKCGASTRSGLHLVCSALKRGLTPAALTLRSLCGARPTLRLRRLSCGHGCVTLT